MAYARSCKNAVEYNSPKSVIELFENLWSDTDNPSVIQLSKEQNDFYVKQSNIFLSKLNSRVKRLDQKKLIDVMAMLKSKSENFQELLDFYSKKGNLTNLSTDIFYTLTKGHGMTAKKKHRP